MTAVDLRPIKRFLGPGEIAEIATEVGISTRQATNIIKGESRNWMFVEKFLQRVERNKSLIEKAQSL